MAEIKILVDETYMPDFSKNIHYITWTPRSDWPLKYKDSYVPYSGLSYPFAVLYSAGFDPIPFFMMVDQNGETGTLYPDANITIMPSGVFEDEDIYKHFGDAVEAQRLIKAESIIFDFRFYNYISPHSFKSNNLEYYKMIDYNKSRFDFDETKVRIYVLVCSGNIIERWYRPLYKSEEFFANQDDLDLI